MDIKDLKTFFQSQVFKYILYGLACVIVLLMVFKAGELVGFRKASFSYRWGENYYRGIAGPSSGSFGEMFRGRDYTTSYGVFGIVEKVASSTLVIKGSDELEKNIVLTNETIIKHFRDTLSAHDLKVNDSVVIIGAPNDMGEIEAKLIRILPINIETTSTTQY